MSAGMVGITQTNSPTYIMMGLARSALQWTLTPATSGDVFAGLAGNMQTTSGAGAFGYVLCYGTGTSPPSYGGAITGTTFTSDNFVGGGSATEPVQPVAVAGLISGMTAGTPYWFDLAFKATVAATLGQINAANVWAFELGGGQVGTTGPAGSTGPTGFAMGAMPDAGFTGWTNSTGPSATGTNIWSMQGYGKKGVGPWTFTPSVTGQLLVTSEFTIVQGASNAQVQNTQLMYGTGTAPVYGGGLTGTVVPSAYGAVANHNAGQFTPVTLQGVIDAQALGVPIWVDIAMNNTNGGGLGVIAGSPLAFSTPPTSCHIVELAGAVGALTGPTGPTGPTGYAITSMPFTGGSGYTGGVILTPLAGVWGMGGFGGSNGGQVAGTNNFTYTPTVTGQVRVTAMGGIIGAADNNLQAQLMYGTGTAPVRAGGLTGAYVPYSTSFTSQTTDFSALVLEGVVSLTAGQLYWFDIAVQAPSVQTQMTIGQSKSPINFSFLELAGAGVTGPTGPVSSAGGTGGGATGPTGFLLHGNILMNWGVGVNNATFGFARAYTDTGPTVTVTPIGATATVRVLKTSLVGAQVNLNPSGQFYWHAIGT